jgi:hypothetical protein
LVFSAAIIFFVSLKIKLVLTVEVDIMINAILWVCLVEGTTLVGQYNYHIKPNSSQLAFSSVKQFSPEALTK